MGDEALQRRFAGPTNRSREIEDGRDALSSVESGNLNEGLQQVLATYGYKYSFRADVWVDCLLEGPQEAWLGQGSDEASALENALKKALPSKLARALLDMAVGELESVDYNGFSQNYVAAVQSVPALKVVATRSQVKSAPVLNRPILRLPTDRTSALERLSVLADRITESRTELAWCTAPRQRLAILAWICEARSHTDVFQNDVAVRESVARVSRQLTEIGKAFWPGSVTALQLQMQPSDLPRHLIGGAPSSWHEAAEMAERALLNLELADERRGFDAYGWADKWALSPRPANPEKVLAELVTHIETAWGPLDRFAEPTNPQNLPRPEHYLLWVRKLRWVRCSDVCPDTWARVMGRLRWWACRRQGPVQNESRELDSSFCPSIGWANLLSEPPQSLAPDHELTVSEAFLREVTDGLKGKRILCLGTRRDPEEQVLLRDALPNADVQWRLIEPTFLTNLASELAEGSFDVVVAAIGLQAQAADLLLTRSCKSAGVRYVRANRGQVMACLRALGRALRA